MQKVFLIILVLVSVCACQSQNKDLLTISNLTMGTSYSIKIVANDIKYDKRALKKDIETILAKINQAMSTYIDDSELSRFNHTKSTAWQSISDDLYEVIEHGIRISILSDGAFDITVGPLVNLWGFGPDPFTQNIPSDLEIAFIKQHTGYAKLSFDKSSKLIAKSDPDIMLDLSGIAKGYAVDKIAQYLDGHGFNNYLVEIGGELIGKGTNAAEQSWKIGIEKANPLSRIVQAIVGLDNIAMATSGDYRNYFEKDGVRYSHTINPVTGKPITHTLASVTVLTASAMHADALATAFMVSGPEKSLSLANELGVALYMLIKTKSGFEERYNHLFKPYLIH
jgi:thiamine biosynthesis lipoprotein